MKCPFEKIITEYIDNRLSNDKANEIKDHLKSCRLCQDKLTELKALSKILGNLSTVKASEGYNARFNEKLKGKDVKEQPSIIYDLRKGYNTFVDKIGIFSPKLVPVRIPVAVALVLVIFLITFFSIGQLSSPRLIALKGDVEVFRSGADDSVEAQEGMKLRKGDRIIIGSSGMLDLQLKDYYKIRVKEDSKFTIKKLYISRKNTDSIFELSSGTVLIKTQGKFKGSNLEIKTPTALLSAKGTGFLVNVNPQNQSTWLGVLDGTVKVTDYFGFVENELALYVNPTKKIIIEDGRMPKDPQALTELERELLEEINDIGKILVNIILSDTPERVFELFEPLSFYVYGSEPKEVQKLAVEATILLDKAIKEDNDSLYLKSISRLERIVDKHPNPRYNPQFLTFIGAYYEYLDLHEEAIKSFEDILRKYPDSDLASIASCAIAIIYEEKLENTSKAIEFYRKTLSIYPNSLETQMAKEGIKRLSK